MRAGLPKVERGQRRHAAQQRLVEPRDFRPHWFDKEFGEPLNHCEETTDGLSGVFIRKYSKATASVDCQTLSGNIQMMESV